MKTAFRLSPCQIGFSGRSDIHSFCENPGYLPVRVGHWLVDEADEARLGLAWRWPLNLHRNAVGNVGLTGLENLVEQIEQALGLKFREHLPHRLIDQLPIPDQLLVSGVRDDEDVVRTADHRNITGSGLKEGCEINWVGHARDVTLLDPLQPLGLASWRRPAL